MEPGVLENWLRASRSSTPSSSSGAAAAAAAAAPPPANSSSSELGAKAIVNAWAQVRVCVQQRKVLTPADAEPFDLLNRHLHSLHLADSQATLLQALLTDVSADDAALLGFVRRVAVVGLLTWIRRSFSGAAGTKAPVSSTRKAPAPGIVESVAQSVLKAVEERPTISDLYVCEAILLLGTISTSPFVSNSVKNDCWTTIGAVLERCRDTIVCGALAEALAGAGHALAVASEDHAVPIFQSLLLLWTPPPPGQNDGRELDSKRSNPRSGDAILKDMVMILHLMDYLSSNFLAKGPSGLYQLEVAQRAILRALEKNMTEGYTVHCASVMAAAGLLRSVYRWDQKNRKLERTDRSERAKLDQHAAILEEFVVKIGEQALPPDVSIFSICLQTAAGDCLSPLQRGICQQQQLCRSVGVALSRCRGLPPHPSLLRCLLLCLFGDGIGLENLYSVGAPEMIVVGTEVKHQPQEDNGAHEGRALKSEIGRALDSAWEQFRSHVDSFFFKELGSIAQAMFFKYRWIQTDLQGQTELLVSQYARTLYAKHRLLLTISQRSEWAGWPQYKQTLEKVLEVVFVTIAMFFSQSVRERTPYGDGNSEAERAALALDSLSCVEYFRHVQLREFSRVVQLGVSQIAGSEAASISLARLLPPYDDIIQRTGASESNPTYDWTEDKVQTARILFYFRVMPLCLIKMPSATFATEIAPLMFLYMQHPSSAVTKASHALFAAFLSLGVKSDIEDQPRGNNVQESSSSGQGSTSEVTLREKLAVAYIQRALQEYPAVTLFQGLVTGVGAIARHLPPGSPAILYCLTSLVDKASSMYLSKSSGNDKTHQGGQFRTGAVGWDISELQKYPDEEIRNAQKLLTLLLHLSLVVDLQVFPASLKLLAKLILGLPQQFQRTALADAFEVIGASDDYTRKPISVPWLQSLSFLIVNGGGNGKTAQNSIDEDASSTDTTRSFAVNKGTGGGDNKVIKITSREDEIQQGDSDTEKQVSNLDTNAESIHAGKLDADGRDTPGSGTEERTDEHEADHESSGVRRSRL